MDWGALEGFEITKTLLRGIFDEEKKSVKEKSRKEGLQAHISASC